MNTKKQEIQFPCNWEFRLIAAGETVQLTKESVLNIGKEKNTVFEITEGETSGGGKYKAVRVSCQVVSIEQARTLAEALAKAEGVRFLI